MLKTARAIAPIPTLWPGIRASNRQEERVDETREAAPRKPPGRGLGTRAENLPRFQGGHNEEQPDQRTRGLRRGLKVAGVGAQDHSLSPVLLPHQRLRAADERLKLRRLPRAHSIADWHSGRRPARLPRRGHDHGTEDPGLFAITGMAKAGPLPSRKMRGGRGSPPCGAPFEGSA
jgi:hypothetical protein